jgi:hypothetical protein
VRQGDFARFEVVAEAEDGDAADATHASTQNKDIAPASVGEVAANDWPHRVANAIQELEHAGVASLFFERDFVCEDDHGDVGHAGSANTLQSSAQKQDSPYRCSRTQDASDGQAADCEFQGCKTTENVGKLAKDWDEGGVGQGEGSDDPVKLIELVCSTSVPVDFRRWWCYLPKCEAMKGSAVATTVRSREDVKKPGRRRRSSFHLYREAAFFSCTQTSHFVSFVSAAVL